MLFPPWLLFPTEQVVLVDDGWAKKMKVEKLFDQISDDEVWTGWCLWFISCFLCEFLCQGTLRNAFTDGRAEPGAFLWPWAPSAVAALL